jgi:hypothetical protein
MSNDPAEKQQAFQRWVTSLRPGADVSAVALGEESGVTSLDDQKTLVRQLPKDVVRQLREREASRHLAVDPDSTAIFHPPPDLIARARRLVPPPKPARSVTASAPPEPVPQQHPTPVVAQPPPEEALMLEDLSQPTLSDAVESEYPPPVGPSLHDQASAPLAELAPTELAPLSKRAAWFGWTAVVVVSALVAASAWFALTHWDWVMQALS